MDLDAVLALWDQPSEAADFRKYYADPVPVNGVPVTAEELAARARGLQAAFADRRTELVHRIETGDQIVIGFYMHVRHVGPYETPLGRAEATGKRLKIRVNDILTVRDGRITDIWVMSDDVDLMRQLGQLPSSV
ncbi:ester cyclase [Dactylosporangium vinaceum]|uniref:Ester cyclase n=1 Tax=Dactylosporangium vinaceum TaxID=53362 RepID=A0ABV5MB79_9ACTN|nr:ester cyclase [Dactylosporangium vinaceum]UAB98357.1 ester cyclase [Dactylosporangium vinaceum]